MSRRRSTSTGPPGAGSRPVGCAVSSASRARDPMSCSCTYRKVVGPLADQGVRAVALDLPGLGLADRPERFDYSWSGLARWLGSAVDALELDRCHLVVHDIGGPIGCEWAIRNPERVHSLTALNMMLEVAGFRRPWSMRPFAVPG